MLDTELTASSVETAASTGVYLVRYGAVPEVARFIPPDGIAPRRGERVVVETHRGLQVGSVLEKLKPTRGESDSETELRIERIASADDVATAARLMDECEDAFQEWCTRIAQWKLNLELIDLEWTLDRQKLILYVLCERGPDSTKLALQAAAAGLGMIEVQPVSSTGLVQPEPSGGSCGSGGGGCGCSH